jgi:regulatory protein
MDNYQKLLNSSYRFLSYRPRSEKEVRDYLKEKIKSQITNPKSQDSILENESRETIEKVIAKLKDYKFIDDEAFTKWFIEQRTKIKPRSSKFIEYELKRKGISEDIIEEVHGKWFMVHSDLDIALELAKKRLPRLENEEPQKKYEKMVRFLASKGFSYDIIKKCIDQVLPKGV